MAAAHCFSMGVNSKFLDIHEYTSKTSRVSTIPSGPAVLLIALTATCSHASRLAEGFSACRIL
jgi:hypothetical protein